MTPKQHAAFLRRFLRDLRPGEPRSLAAWSRLALGFPLAVGLSLATTGCSGETSGSADPEVCGDGEDNDGDGASDCADTDCGDDVLCVGQPEYGIPYEQDCADGVDNDSDGVRDCADPDCAADCGGTGGAGSGGDAGTAGMGGTLYGIAFGGTGGASGVETACDDRLDNDRDGALDCVDPDCASNVLCMGQPTYGVPFEGNCTDQIDNDYDGALDCVDPDCASNVLCMGQPDYAVPLEYNCTDRLDDDGDGAIDCADEECVDHPSCIAQPAYAVPLGGTGGTGGTGGERYGVPMGGTTS